MHSQQRVTYLDINTDYRTELMSFAPDALTLEFSTNTPEAKYDSMSFDVRTEFHIPSYGEFIELGNRERIRNNDSPLFRLYKFQSETCYAETAIALPPAFDVRCMKCKKRTSNVHWRTHGSESHVHFQCECKWVFTVPRRQLRPCSYCRRTQVEIGTCCTLCALLTSSIYSSMLKAIPPHEEYIETHFDDNNNFQCDVAVKPVKHRAVAIIVGIASSQYDTSLIDKHNYMCSEQMNFRVWADFINQMKEYYVNRIRV